MAAAWRVVNGDILDVQAKALVCSANPYLTLSGGVGGAFLLRYGSAMQSFLSDYLKTRELRYAEQGDVIASPPCGSPYQVVYHAVAVDRAYRSSSSIVETILVKLLGEAESEGIASIVIPALATGYGPLTMKDFDRAVISAWQRFTGQCAVTICLQRCEDAQRLASALERA